LTVYGCEYVSAFNILKPFKLHWHSLLSPLLIHPHQVTLFDKFCRSHFAETHELSFGLQYRNVYLIGL